MVIGFIEVRKLSLELINQTNILRQIRQEVEKLCWDMNIKIRLKN